MSQAHKDKFVALLEELFQLNQPELDFGLYRILHARSAQIKAFVQNELKDEIDKVFASQAQAGAHDILKAARLKVEQTLGVTAINASGELKPEFVKTNIGEEYQLARQQAQEGGGPLADDAQVYDHLYRFFSRYYDKGDFMSKRYFVAENDSRAAPYAIPYDGREVMLHWANKDQYYIKSSEYLTNYTVDLAAAQKLARQGAQAGFEFEASEAPLKVHFRLAAASEGEHNNVKEGQERYFLIHTEEPIVLLLANGGREEPARLSPSPLAGRSPLATFAIGEGRGEGAAAQEGDQELIIHFQYRPDPEKTGQSNTWQQKRLAEAEALIRERLAALPAAQSFADALLTPAPTDKQPNRSLLAKYLGQYTSRNTMDYFIHKNLGGFLRRELDFYLKNEVMRLDDIENAEAPRVETYLKKLQSLRKIARRIIDFLAQIEDFQKKLWLKKKFVVETNYCITLDRIPETFYPEIAANEAQREEWVRLFAIDEISGDTAKVGYTTPLTVKFLNENPYLPLDTAFLSEYIKARLMATLADFETSCDGTLIHSENFQAICLAKQKLRKTTHCIYIDPPYNTGNDGFIYKDNYSESSWASMMSDRINLSLQLLTENAPILVSLDDKESSILKELMRSESMQQHGEFVWRTRNTDNRVISNFSLDHESIHVFTSIGASLSGRTIDRSNFKNTDNDPRGPYTTDPLTGKANATQRPNLHYLVTNVITGDVYPPEPDFGWITDRAGFDALIANELIHWPANPKSGKPRKKRFLKDSPVKGPISSFGLAIKQGEGNQGLADLFGFKALNFPKPVSVMESVIDAATDDCGVVVDYFAGSGTTGHAVIKMNRNGSSRRRYILVEAGEHFDSILKPRIKKSIYSSTWKDGRPVSRDGISHCFKYLRLESYEDTLNNLVLPKDSPVDAQDPANAELARDYLLKYWLDFETAGSPSLLNIRQFADPTNYSLLVKQPGSDAQVTKKVDLVETFNWLIGLHVALLDQPRCYQIDLAREVDADLPKDQDTRWITKSIKERDDGEFWFRWVEGYVLAVPGDETSRQRVLVLWRKLGGDAGRDQAALEAYLATKKLNPLESEFDYIYINGSHALPSDGSASTRVRLIEETFAQRMWEDA